MRARILAFWGFLFAAIMLSASPAAADDHYAAIAFSSSSGALGWSNDYSSRDDAEEEALRECGPGCTVVIWFKNACGAIATSPDHGYGSGWADSRGEAEATAMRVCRENTSNCSVQRWTCTTR
jgi:hypothetical protein